MNCREIRHYINLYLDSELDAKTDLAISEHLAICEQCNKRFSHEQKIEQGLFSLFFAPKDIVEEKREINKIWAKLALMIDKEDKDMRGVSPRLNKRYFILTPAISAVIAIALLLIVYYFPRSEELIISASKCHQEYLENRIVPTIKTQIPQEVTDYFTKQLNYAIKLPAYNNNTNKAKLIGARICHLKGIQVAYVMYNYQSLPLSLFFLGERELDNFPDEKWMLSKHGCIEKRNIFGSNLVAMRTNGTIVCAVSKLDLQLLREIVKDCGTR